MKKVLFAILTLGLAVMLCGCGTKKVDLGEYFDYELTGYDGYAAVTAQIDKNGIEKQIMEITDKSAAEIIDDLHSVEGSIDRDGRWSKSVDLKNGDKITYSWNIDEGMLKDKYGIVFECKNVDIEVSGLQVVETFDPFENVSLNYYGIYPENLFRAIKDNDYEYKKIDFVPETWNGGANGDQIVVRAVVKGNEDADLTEMCMETYGKVPSRTEMTMTVSGCDKYVFTEDDLSEEDWDKLKKDTEDYINADFAKNSIDSESMVSLEYVGNYILRRKSFGRGITGWRNMVYMVYKITVTNTDVTGNFDYYYYRCYENVIKEGNGNFPIEKTMTQEPRGGSLVGTYGNVVETGKHYYVGFDRFKDLYEDCVTVNLNDYDFEDNAKEPDGHVSYKDVLK